MIERALIMLTNNYLYIKDNAYILFDRDSMRFYVIPIDIGEKLDNLEDDVRNEILEKTLASKRKNLCFETSSIDEEKCSRLVLVLAQHCNLACKYCYAEDGTYGDRFSRIMSE